MKTKLYLAIAVVALLCLATWISRVHGQQGGPTRQIWVYHVDPVPNVCSMCGIQPAEDEAVAIQNLINQRAAQGWELAAVGTSKLYFKRPK